MLTDGGGRAVRQTGWFNHRIVVVTAASLLAGLGVGVIVRLFVIWLAFTYDGRPLPRFPFESFSQVSPGAGPADAEMSAS